MAFVKIKRILSKWLILRNIKRILFPLSIIGTGNRIECKCQTSKRFDFRIYVRGNNNVIKIASTCQLYNTTILINGNNNVLILGEEVKMQMGTLNLSGSGQLIIGRNTTFQEVDMFVTKDKTIIGKDCMFSYGVIIRNYDGHKIVDLATGEICNSPRDIVFEDHVWISQNVTILGGVEIGENSIIGVGSIVTRSLPSNCVAAGIPAKVIKHNRSWIRH